jgi:hypothetical protein
MSKTERLPSNVSSKLAVILKVLHFIVLVKNYSIPEDSCASVIGENTIYVMFKTLDEDNPIAVRTGRDPLKCYCRFGSQISL